MLIPGVKDGSNISILNIFHTYPEKQPDGKWSKNILTVVYKDLDTGLVHKYEDDNPEYEYYMVKDNVNTVGDHDLFSRLEDCDKFIVPYSQLDKDIATRTNTLTEFKANINRGNRSGNKFVHLMPKVRLSDLKLESNFLLRFDRTYKNEVYTPTKGYFDIETDNRFLPEGEEFPSGGIVPINAIAYVNASKMVVNSYVLRDNSKSNVEFYNEFVNDHTKVINELKTMLVNHVDPTLYKRSFEGLKFSFKFFEDETQMIYKFFTDVNEDKLDICMAWNMAFDYPYLYDRLVVLGQDPSTIIPHPDFKYKFCKYKLDNFSQVIAMKNDSYKVSSYTKYIDQMVVFAGRRKSDTSIKSFKLDNIGRMICGVNKLDWSHIAKTFAEFIKKDFKTFIFYNIIDTLVQKCIEDDIGDMEYIIASSIRNCTDLDKIFKQTTTLVNRVAKESYKDGFILGTNHNYNNEKIDKYPGAFVADGSKLNDFAMVRINNTPVRLFNNLDDYDYKALYPNLIIQFNISVSTQIGRLIIPGKIEGENKYNNQYYTRAGRYIEDYASRNHLAFGNTWLGLGKFEELYEDVYEYLYMNGQIVHGCRKQYVLEKLKDNLEPLFIEAKYSTALFTPIYKEVDAKFKNMANSIRIADIVDTTYTPDDGGDK